LKNSMNPSFPQIIMNIQFNSKPSNISIWLTNHNGYPN